MSGLLPQHGEILLYDNGTDKQFVSVVFKDETFWLTQSGMAELFDCSADNISLHLKNIYADGELEQAATTEKFSVVRKEGSREVRRSIDHYDLDAIIAVGYRVNSKKATHFRQWATKTLKEYIQKGFVLNDELMKKTEKDTTVVMHCLPAVKGNEVTEDVFEKHAEVIFDEAENRMHTIKAVMVATLGEK